MLHYPLPQQKEKIQICFQHKTIINFKWYLISESGTNLHEFSLQYKAYLFPPSK